MHIASKLELPVLRSITSLHLAALTFLTKEEADQLHEKLHRRAQNSKQPFDWAAARGQNYPRALDNLVLKAFPSLTELGVAKMAELPRGNNEGFFSRLEDVLLSKLKRVRRLCVYQFHLYDHSAATLAACLPGPAELHFIQRSDEGVGKLKREMAKADVRHVNVSCSYVRQFPLQWFDCERSWPRFSCVG